MFDFFKTKKSEIIKCSGDNCQHATRPRGAHCNFQGVLLQPYKPKLLHMDMYDVQDLLLKNPYGSGLTKLSTVFPKSWSPIECTQKVIEAISSENKKVISMSRFGLLKIVGYTSENIEIIAFYDSNKATLALFYPNFQEEGL